MLLLLHITAMAGTNYHGSDDTTTTLMVLATATTVRLAIMAKVMVAVGAMVATWVGGWLLIAAAADAIAATAASPTVGGCFSGAGLGGLLVPPLPLLLRLRPRKTPDIRTT